MNENLIYLLNINKRINHVMIPNIQIIDKENQILLMLEDIEQMNAVVKQNDIEPKNILYYQ